MKQELSKILTMLEQAGLNPQVCDTPISYDHRAVACGRPVMPGDESGGDYCLLPRRLMGCTPEFYIDIVGDSMRDVGFEAGDRIRVRTDVAVRDGDIVVATCSPMRRGDAGWCPRMPTSCRYCSPTRWR